MDTLNLPLSPDTFDLYLREINRIEPVSREEEQALARKLRDSCDLQAAHRLITGHLRFVVKVANEYRGYGLRLSDLVQEGNIGLMMAVKKFDPDRGIRLITYAVWWIRAYIQNYIIRSWSLVKIGTTQAQKKLFFKLSQAREAIRRLGGKDDAEAVAEELAVRCQTVDEMSQRLEGRDLSLDVELFEEDGYTILDNLADDRDNQEELLLKNESATLTSARVASALATLNAREQQIVSERILADEPRTLQELADDFGVTRERIRQLEKNALGKLRQVLVSG